MQYTFCLYGHCTLYTKLLPLFTHKCILTNSSFTSSTKHVHSSPYYYGAHVPIVTPTDVGHRWVCHSMITHVCICDESTLHYALIVITFIYNPPDTIDIILADFLNFNVFVKLTSILVSDLL